MNDLFNKIIAEAKNFSLTEEEKKDILTQLSSHMKNSPANLKKNPIISPYHSSVMGRENHRHILHSSLRSRLLISLSVLRKNTYMPIIILLMIMLGGGTSLAANSALPGDALYPVKVNINEKIESLVAIGAKADAKFEATLADKRLKEAEKLSLRGEISGEMKDKIKGDFVKHADNLGRLVAMLRDAGDEDIAAILNSDFESSLRMHHLVLAVLAKDEGGKLDLDEIKTAVALHLKTVKDLRFEDEKEVIDSDEVSVQTAAEGALKSANNKIAEVERYIDSKNRKVIAEVKAQAVAELNVAKNEIVQGKAKLESKAYGEAFVLFKKAHRTAQEAKLMLNSEHEFKIDLDIDNEDDDAQESREVKIKSSSNLDINSHKDSDLDDEDKDENETENKEVKGEGRLQNILNLGL